jgi:hypothetical protein
MTPCYYCEEDADVACRACIHSSTGPEIEQVIAWRAAPPPAADADATSRRAYEYAGDYAALAGGPMAPAADAVSEAMLQAFLRAMHETPAYPNDMTDEQWRAVLDAALAAKGD